MKWRPSPPELIQTFEEVSPGPPAVRRKMFGYPAAFVNGNMFLGLFQDQMIVRLPERDREVLIRSGAMAFEPMPGRPMREYVALTPDIIGDRKSLSSWVRKALAYGRSLPPKAPRETKNKSAAKRPGRSSGRAGARL